MKVDTGIGSNLASVPARASSAEKAGLNCLWASETVNDPFLTLALAAEHTTDVVLGTAITIAFAAQSDEPGVYNEPTTGVLPGAFDRGSRFTGEGAYRAPVQLAVVPPSGTHARVRPRVAGHLVILQRRRAA